jgi:predicted PurR-regulated permease PerM
MFDSIKNVYKNEEAFRATIVLAIACVFVYVIFAALSPVVWPFIVSIILASILNTGVNKLKKIGISRTLGAAMLTALLVVLAVFIVGVASFFVQKHLLFYSKHIKSTVQFLADWIPQKLSDLSAYAHLPIDINAEKIREYILASIGGMTDSLGRYALSLYNGAKSVVSVFSFMFFVPIITFYLTKDWPRCVAKLREYTPNRILAFTDFAIPRAKKQLKDQISGQFKVSMIVLPVYCAGLWAIGLNPFIALGILSSILTFVPFLGVFVAFIATFVLALAQGLQLVHIILITVLYFVCSSIESNFLTPHFVGGKIGLHPVWIFFAVLTISACVGIIGALFVMPLATLIWSVIKSALIWLRGEDTTPPIGA